MDEPDRMTVSQTIRLIGIAMIMVFAFVTPSFPIVAVNVLKIDIPGEYITQWVRVSFLIALTGCLLTLLSFFPKRQT